MKPIKEQKIRKSVPRGLGRKKEKPGSRADFQGVHRVRSLSNLLSQRISEHATSHEPSRVCLTTDTLKGVKDWLRDVEHDYRMRDECDAQDVLFDLLKRLESEFET